MDQSSYIRKIFCDFNIQDCHSVSTPIDGYHPLIQSEFLGPKTNMVEYQIRIRSVMYLMIDTRPDNSFTVCKRSQYCQDLSVRHRTELD